MLASIFSLLRETSGTTLTLTGVLGLAAVLYALYQLRGGPAGRKPDDLGNQQQPFNPSQPSTSAAGGAAAPKAAAAAGAAAAQPAPTAAVTRSTAVARRLAGVRRVTLSVPGVLLEESNAEELEESASASVHAGVAELVHEIARTADLYLICHVSDDVGEAVVRGALEHAGLTGSRPGQVAPHRLLFCGTLLGKVSMVRQLDPGMHVDAHPQTVSDLQRFVKQLVLVQQPKAAAAAGSSSAPLAAANVQHALSLAGALGLPC